MTPTTSHVYSSLFMLVVGLGMGLIMPITTIAVQNAVPQEDLGVATSSSVFFRSMGASFGVAILGAVMNARLRYWFPALRPTQRWHRRHPPSPSARPRSTSFLSRSARGSSKPSATLCTWSSLVAAPLSMLVFPLILKVKEIRFATARVHR